MAKQSVLIMGKPWCKLVGSGLLIVRKPKDDSVLAAVKD